MGDILVALCSRTDQFWKNLKLSNFDILIYNFFVNCNPYYGLVIIDDGFLSLCNSESGFSKAVFAGVWEMKNWRTVSWLRLTDTHRMMTLLNGWQICYNCINGYKRGSFLQLQTNGTLPLQLALRLQPRPWIVSRCVTQWMMTNTGWHWAGWHRGDSRVSGCEEIGKKRQLTYM